MAKRLTDSTKWRDAWFMDLPCKYKLFWLYLLDECDHAGIWKINFKTASFCIGEDYHIDEVKEVFKERIEFLDGYWWIRKFVDFQYGGIKSDNVGKSVEKTLLRHNLLGAKEGLPSPWAGALVKDKVKVIINYPSEILKSDESFWEQQVKMQFKKVDHEGILIAWEAWYINKFDWRRKELQDMKLSYLSWLKDPRAFEKKEFKINPKVH